MLDINKQAWDLMKAQKNLEDVSYKSWEEVPLEIKETYLEKIIEFDKKELAFFRSIDFVSMGKFIEYEKHCDLTGWEFLAHGWRNKNEAKCLWYIQQRWNKNFHYNEIFDYNKDVENEQIRGLLLNISICNRWLKENEEEIEELKQIIENLKKEQK